MTCVSRNRTPEKDGLLPCLPYMRPSWPPGSTGEQGSSRDSSVMVNGILDLNPNPPGTYYMGPQEPLYSRSLGG